MNLQDLTLQQLKEIVDGAPEGATHVDLNLDTSGLIFYKDEPNQRLSIRVKTKWLPSFRSAVDETNLIKLSDIRAQIEKIEAEKDTNVTLSAGSADIKGIDESEKPVFKVGDRVVPESEATNLIRAVREVLEVDGDQIRYHMEAQVRSYWSKAKGWRHATPEEEAAGHRIDSVSAEMASPCPASDSATNQAEMDLQNNESEPCNHVPFDLGHDDDQGNRDCLRCGKTLSAIEVDRLWRGYANTVTTQLDPKKCRIVDPALAYDEPTKRRVGWVGCLGAGAGATGYVPEGNQNDFDAMSEKHRSPACKCHELPIDAELKPDPVNHPSHYTSDPSGIECIQITRHRNFNIGNAMKYLWRAGLKDQSATAQDLQKAIWYINDEIERLEGEQGE